MLSNTLLQIETIITQKLNKETTAAILEFFKHYKYGMWIYPGVLKRKFDLSIDMIYMILDEMEKGGILQSYYELYCSQCQKSMGTVQLFNELPDTFYCEICNAELPALENTILIYKVISHE